MIEISEGAILFPEIILVDCPVKSSENVIIINILLTMVRYANH